jgi:hypothetical protein
VFDDSHPLGLKKGACLLRAFEDVDLVEAGHGSTVEAQGSTVKTKYFVGKSRTARPGKYAQTVVVA